MTLGWRYYFRCDIVVLMTSGPWCCGDIMAYLTLGTGDVRSVVTLGFSENHGYVMAVVTLGH